MRDDILTELKTLNAEEFVSTFVIERIPFIFAEDWPLYRRWRQKLSELLDIDPCDICLVGSSSVGVSLNPSKSYREFSDESDIDVAIVSEYYFDVAWRSLRTMRLSDANNAKERFSIKKHAEGLVYWGCVATDKILRLLPFSGQWSRAAIEMASEHPTEGREINFRIYRDYKSLRSYHMRNIENFGGE